MNDARHILVDCNEAKQSKMAFCLSIEKKVKEARRVVFCHLVAFSKPDFEVLSLLILLNGAIYEV